ncbi:MAG TPA: hypothetical protein VFE15_09370 [Marmoricola sp.]|jgi:hypothetical protein|nr:hypothetical protein [Marmoricola sp.]
MRRTARCLLPLFGLLLGLSVVPAWADGTIPPPIAPPGVTVPGSAGGGSTPGPTYVVTPGSTGTGLGHPVGKAGLEQAKKADQTAKAKPGAPRTKGQRTATPVATPAEDGDVAGAGGGGSTATWLMVASGGLLAYLLLDLLRVVLRRRLR